MRMQAFVNTLNQGLVTPVWKSDYEESVNNGFPILIWQTKPSTKIEAITIENNLSLYPNPAKDYLFIQSDYPVEKVEIYSQSGTLVQVNNNPMEILDVSRLANGFYLARVFVNGMATTQKIVIKRN